MSRLTEVIDCHKYGLTREQTAILLGISEEELRVYISKAGIKGWATSFQASKVKRDRLIVEMYSRNVPVRQIAKTVGLTYGSLKVIAHRLGCTKHGTEWIDYRRGFSIPEDKQADFQELVYDLKFKVKDAIAILGIEPLYQAPDADHAETSEVRATA